MSASSSFFLLILSLSVSASRRACWMRACIASGDTSLDRPGSISVSDALIQSNRNWQLVGDGGDLDGRELSVGGEGG